jgi:hypothetical protein
MVVQFYCNFQEFRWKWGLQKKAARSEWVSGHNSQIHRLQNFVQLKLKRDCKRWPSVYGVALTHNFMSILWKMTVFIEKSPVTSSNCCKTIKTASILIKLGTNLDLTIAFATTCSGLNFLLPWQRGDISKFPKITMRGTAARFKPPQTQRGTSPFW